jgi:SAM-dependent methyltransferase
LLDDQFEYTGRELEVMSFAQNYYQWIIDEFQPFIGENVAEVGAGTGNFSKLILKNNVKNLVVCEPSKNMYPLLCKRLDGEQRTQTFQSYFKEFAGKFQHQFDTIFYINVLEHIKEEYQELAFARATLKNDGYICIFVPALTWLYSNFDASIGHFRRYNKSQLMKLMNDTGFEVVRLLYLDFVGIIPWYILFVLLRKEPHGKLVSQYDKIVVPIMRTIGSLFNIPIGKNLLLVGRKA